MRELSIQEQQDKALEAIEQATVAREWLDSMRASLIDTLQTAQLDVSRYKEAASDAARYGVRVRRSEALDESMSDAIRLLVELNESMGEWSA